MTTKTVNIPNISCGHCVHTIQNEVSDLKGIKSVVVDEATKMVRIEWDQPQTWENIAALLEEINYPAEA